MSAIVPYNPEAKAPLRLEHTCNGHVVTPWFALQNFSESERENWNSRYYEMISHAKSVFASFLGIDKNAIVVTQLNDPNDGPKWRLGTAHKCALPQKPKLRLHSLHDLPAIDV